MGESNDQRMPHDAMPHIISIFSPSQRFIFSSFHQSPIFSSFIKFKVLSSLHPSLIMKATGRPSLSEEDHFLDRPCGNCRKPNSRAYCRRCMVSDVGQLRVFYCSPACQAAHWDTHRETCKGIRQLSRAVSFVAELWTMFEAEYCPVTAKFVSEKKGVVRMEALGQGEDPRPWMGKSVLESVLVGQVPERLRPAIRTAVYGMQHCSPLSLTAHTLLEFVFHGTSRLLSRHLGSHLLT